MITQYEFLIEHWRREARRHEDAAIELHWTEGEDVEREDERILHTEIARVLKACAKDLELLSNDGR